MIHIELAPAGGIGESVLEETIFEFRTQDHSHPGTKWKLIKSARLELCQSPFSTIPYLGITLLLYCPGYRINEPLLVFFLHR